MFISQTVVVPRNCNNYIAMSKFKVLQRRKLFNEASDIADDNCVNEWLPFPSLLPDNYTYSYKKVSLWLTTSWMFFGQA